MKIYKISSPAKINLTLEIIKKLPDGFHGLRSIMLKTKNLKDEVEIIFDEKRAGIKIFCNKRNIPTDEKNICYKIAERFFMVSGKRIGLVIKLRKNIPALAGLGGGSSNGAVTLLTLNKYFGEPLKFSELIKLASDIGKDIPIFLLKENAVYVSGAGEKLKPINNFPQLHLILINPKGEIETGWAYGELDKHLWFMEDERRQNLSLKMVRHLESGVKINGLLYNDFTTVVEELFPIIKELKNCLLSLGAVDVSITGKGPTVVGVLTSKKMALEIKAIIGKHYPEFWVEVA